MAALARKRDARANINGNFMELSLVTTMEKAWSPVAEDFRNSEPQNV
jgi:hypothetical protein